MFPKIKKRRNNNKRLLDAFEAFEPASPDLIEGTCGNIAELVNPKFTKVGDEYKHIGGIFKGKTFYEKVSAPYLLAKLVAAYSGIQVTTEGQDGYKVTWTLVLKHKESGHVVTFYDWKGAASIGSDVFPSSNDAQFKKDFIKLVKALADERFPHPYDGCVIGEVA